MRLQRRLRDEEDGRPLQWGANGHGNRGSPRNNASSSSTVWKILSFLLLVLLVLIVTETIEVKKPTAETIDGQPSLGGIVQIKANLPSLLSVNSAQEEKQPQQNEVGQSPKQADPTSPPTEVPKPPPTTSPTEVPKPDPTNPPTEAPKPDPTIAPTIGPMKEEPQHDPQNEKPQVETKQIDPQPEQQAAAATPADLTSARTTVRHTYKKRGQPMTAEDRKAMIEKWGQWTVVDDKERPTTDYYDAYPNRDIPRSAFPPNAWQVDTEYLSKFLPEAIELVDRAIEAILSEYGKTDGTFEERAEMFELEMSESLENVNGYIIKKPEWRKDEQGERGGWSTTKSLEGLKRRLLHAVMTEDTFIFALAGHSAAAGHGNMFVQSYSIQVQWIMEAIFARLGVRHEARNLANGGLGTVQVGTVDLLQKFRAKS